MSISFGTINKRDRFVHSLNEDQNDSLVRMRIEKLDENISKELDKDNGSVTPQIRQQMNLFIESIQSPGNASRFIDDALEFIGKYNQLDESYAVEELASIRSLVLPYVDTKELSRIVEAMNYFNLKESQSSKLLEEINEFQVADRILANHQRISKRFNVEEDVNALMNSGLHSVVESVGNMISTFNIKPYQKLNVCLEELVYLLDKNGCKYDKSDLVYEVARNMLLTNEINRSEINGFKEALTKSHCVDPKDLGRVDFIVNESDETPETVQGFTETFLLNPNKTMTSLVHLCEDVGSKASMVDLSQHIDQTIDLLYECYIADILQEDGLDLTINTLVDAINERDNLEENFMKAISEKFVKYSTDPKFKYPALKEDRIKYKHFQEKAIYTSEAINETATLLYDEDNINALTFDENADFIPLKEFKVFKFNNLIKAAFNLNKYLKQKSRIAMKKPKAKLSKIISRARNILFGEATEIDVADYQDRILEFVTDDGRVNITVLQLEYSSEEESELKQFLKEACKEFNNKLTLESKFDTKAYYIMNPSIAEVHIRENVILDLNESEVEEMINTEGNELDIYIENFINGCLALKEVSDKSMSFDKFQKTFFNDQDMTKEHAELAMEVMPMIGITESQIEAFAEAYKVSDIRRNVFNRDYKCDLNIPVYESAENITTLESLEAYNILMSILEAKPMIKKPEIKKPDIKMPSIKKPEDKKDSGDDKNKNPKMSDEEQVDKFGAKLNDLRLSMEGLKGKMKDMSQKEQEMSKNLDNNVRRLAKGMKDALISDRREAIIKGSIIPSFSKCIKIGIGLAAAGVVFNPMVPIIAAVGGFAMSKKLTKQERMLLLDDIAIELEVIDKEIANAESKNQMKKYRALLKQKKDLQRQYQRIKYNVRIGKDIMPGSTNGVKKLD